MEKEGLKKRFLKQDNKVFKQKEKEGVFCWGMGIREMKDL